MSVNVPSMAKNEPHVRSKLLFVMNVDWFFMSHRLPIALDAMRVCYGNPFGNRAPLILLLPR